MTHRSLLLVAFFTAVLAHADIGNAPGPSIAAAVEECEITSNIAYPQAIVHTTGLQTIQCSLHDTGFSCADRHLKLEHDTNEALRTTYRAACLHHRVDV